MCLRVGWLVFVLSFSPPRIFISNGSDYDVFSVSASFYLLLYMSLPFAVFLENILLIQIDYFYNQDC